MNKGRWYGNDPAWRYPMERDAKRHYGRLIRAIDGPGWLAYKHQGVEVRGRIEAVPVEIRFYASPPYATYGLTPDEYPRVFADRGAASKHRMPGDGALCLYYAADPEERRWTPSRGLLALFDLISDHLFFEDYWRETTEWLGPEAPHGFAA
ncbi:hypothetical protein ACQ86L_0375 (plasmid) [Leifsonia sp. P73]|uniref:hypothetical protein n=2 Tax=unclassified Leifsonia TaxID=2663824 RepID=UPI003D3F18B9